MTSVRPTKKSRSAAATPEVAESGGESLSDARRKALIGAAFQVLAERGFEGLRTRDVAALAGMNIATLHYYFAAKEDLIAGVAEELLRRFETLGSSLAIVHPYERLRSELVVIRREFKERPATFAVLNEIWVRASRDPVIAAVCRRIDARWHAFIKEAVVDGQGRGVLRASLSPDGVATLFTAYVRGAVLRLFADPDAKWLKKASDELLTMLEVESPAPVRKAVPVRRPRPGPRR